MILNYEQFSEYLYTHGETVAKTTEDWNNIPKGTPIKFRIEEGVNVLLTSWFEEQIEYHNFDVCWNAAWRDCYQGQFEVEDVVSNNTDLPTYILCSTPELAKQVLEKIEREHHNKRWISSIEPTDFIPPSHYPEMVINTRHNYILYGSKECYITLYGVTNFTLAEDYLDIKKETTNKLNKPKGNKFMTNILEFAKNLSLTKEEKALIEANLQDDDGNWTENARQIVKDKKAKKLGYKDEADMITKLGVDDYECSPFEYHALFVEFTDELQTIANKFVASKKEKK